MINTEIAARLNKIARLFDEQWANEGKTNYPHS
jgi:hypothetical protein